MSCIATIGNNNNNDKILIAIKPHYTRQSYNHYTAKEVGTKSYKIGIGVSDKHTQKNTKYKWSQKIDYIGRFWWSLLCIVWKFGEACKSHSIIDPIKFVDLCVY